MKWGEARSTDDLEGEVIKTSHKRPSLIEIERILPQFIGKIMQTPPVYSAVKVNGKRAYALARSGADVVLTSREITIYSLVLMDKTTQEEAWFCCECAKGTYIRSLARDMAETLGTCGYVSSLKREAVGKFSSGRAISLDSLEELVHIPASERADALSEWLLPVSTVLDDIPAIAVEKAMAQRLRHGQTLRLDGIDIQGKVAAFTDDMLIALCDADHGKLQPVRVFNMLSEGER